MTATTTVLVPVPEALEQRIAALEILEVRETPDGIERLGRLRYLERNHPNLGTDYVAVCTTLAYRLGRRHPWIAAGGISVVHVAADRWYDWRALELAEVLT